MRQLLDRYSLFMADLQLPPNYRTEQYKPDSFSILVGKSCVDIEIKHAKCRTTLAWHKLSKLNTGCPITKSEVAESSLSPILFRYEAKLKFRKINGVYMQINTGIQYVKMVDSIM